MNDVWRWVIGIAIGLVIIALVAGVRSNRQSYWVARHAMYRHVVVVQVPSDQVLNWRLHHYNER